MSGKAIAFHACTVFCAVISGGCAARHMYHATVVWTVAILIWQWLMHDEISRNNQEATL